MGVYLAFGALAEGGVERAFLLGGGCCAAALLLYLLGMGKPARPAHGA